MLPADTIQTREDGSRYVLAYNYSEVTGAYLGFEEADESPLEPGVFLLPAYSTAIAPPAQQAGFVRTWTGSEWIQEPIPVAPAPPEPDLAELARTQRNALLADSDFSQLTDVPLSNRSEWATYRQALRDVPEQAGFPETINWPTKPEYIKT